MEDGKEQENKSNVEELKDSVLKKNINNVVYTIKPEIVLEYCMGMYRFQLVNGRLCTPNLKMKMFGIFVILIYVAVFFSYFVYPLTYVVDTSHFVDTIDELPSVVVLIQYVATAIITSFFVNSINIRIFTSLAELDTMLQVETFQDFYKRLRSQLNKYLILLIISHIVNGVVDWMSVEDVQGGILVFPLYFTQKLEVFVFCAYIYMIRCRLMMINLYLKTFVQEQDKKSTTVFTVRDTKIETQQTYNFIGRPSERNMKIRDLAKMYDNIGNICAMINEIFNFQIFMTLVATFTYIVITIWTSLYYYRTPENNSSQLVNIAIWCFSTICNVAIMSFACEKLLQVRNETKVLVNKIIMNYDLPKTMRVQAKAFMELVEAWQLRIYIYDMFSVDITLMLKFISVATTYLIVIIQISHFI